MNTTEDTPLVAGMPVTIAMLEEDHIRRIVASAATIQYAAIILGIDQATLYRKRKRMGLPVQQHSHP